MVYRFSCGGSKYNSSIIENIVNKYVDIFYDGLYCLVYVYFENKFLAFQNSNFCVNNTKLTSLIIVDTKKCFLYYCLSLELGTSFNSFKRWH